jgi:ubiquinone/menaquinone biosynthesis C-methylase UbiE
MKLFDYLLGWREWDIQKGDMVLEVGSGGSPMVRSNILVDKYINNDSNRELCITIDRPLICAEIENLPFKDGSFDFVYASHVLEHIAKIEEAIAEFVRVGKTGVVIVPGEIFERAWDKGTHRWIINKNDEKLIFREKCACTRLKQGNVLGKWRKIFWEIYVKNRSLLDIQLFWKNHIPYEIIRCEKCFEIDKSILNHSEQIIRKLIFKKKLKQKILIQLSRIIRLIYT